MKVLKRVLAFTLSVALILQLIPTQFVAYAVGIPSYTEESFSLEEVPTGYTGIYTKKDLNNVRNNLSGNYILMNDIEFTAADFNESGSYYNDGQGWLPIGENDVSAFTGTFDGNEYAIKNLYVNTLSSSEAYAGLFGYNSGTIENLGMVDGIVSATTSSSENYTNIGGIVGYNDEGTINNCYNTGSVNSSYSENSCVGGIVGDNIGGIISNCINTGSVSAKSSYYTYCGGIAGVSSGTISDCYNTGILSADSNLSEVYAGGIAGYNYGTVSICYNSGSVSASTYYSEYYPNIGGIVGYNDGGTISICYNTGSVSTTYSKNSCVGGIVGDNTGGTITYCTNIGSVSAESYYYTYGGGIAGYSSGNISDCDNAGIVSAISYGNNTCGGGIAGYSNGDISNCYNTGILISYATSSDVYAGGIAGINEGNINNCYNTGNVNETSSSNNAYIGGIVGWNNNTIINCYNTGNVVETSFSAYFMFGGIAGVNSGAISNCYNTGNVKETSSSGNIFWGGINGYNEGTISSCYYLNNTSRGVGNGSDTTVQLTLEQMKKQSSYVGFDFNTVWAMYPNYLPCLKAISNINLESITFETTTVDIGINSQYQNSIITTPYNIPFLFIEYTSLDENIATVDANGNITSKSLGSTNIMATDTITGKTALCTVNVLPPLTYVTLDTNVLSLAVGGTYQLLASINPDNAYNQNVRWETGDTSIATVDMEGNVTAVAKGTTSIRVITEDGNKQDSCVVTVGEAVTNIELNETSVNLVEGLEQTLTVKSILPEEAIIKTVEWTSSNEDIAVVDQNGKITAISVGSCTIRATATDGSGVYADCVVNVVAAPPVLYGDVNGDNNINPMDVTILARYNAKWQGVNLANPMTADINNDGDINPMDLTVLRRHVAKWAGYETIPM